MIYMSKSPAQTQKIAALIAKKAIKYKQGQVLVLEGELGAGKTTFVQGFAKAVGIKSKIKSPTFVLMKHYKIPGTDKILFHLDCYRARDHRDLATLDLKNVFSLPQNIVLVEWPERVIKILPKKYTRIHIDHINKNSRKITINNF